MGVPSFYRWLVGKYPRIVCDASDQKNPDDLELEFDNLYLDMNGIIHPCFHPEDNTVIPPTTFEDVFQNIYEYVDKLFDIVRPRKLLFLAIDGVAPRAKMNQQRARRFKTAKDNENFEEVEKKFRKQFEMCGKNFLPREETEVADSNVITPGTEFMHLLSKKLQCYVKLKMNKDPRWKTIKVILSDANVPGEGEHKIMSFIRAQRCWEGYNPNTRHCLYGLDADLIMLALATHEVHFAILRECVLTQQERGNSMSEQLEHSANKRRGWFSQFVDKQESMLESHHPGVASGSGNSNRHDEHITPAKNVRFQFLKVWLLREYLAIDIYISNPPENVKIDTERIIDDFIFICFFAGNDFLPHMPTLEIHEGAIDLLIHVYRNEFKNLGGYLFDVQWIEDKKNGFIKLKRVENFILSVGEYEEKIFKKRTEISERKIRKILSEQLNDVEDEDHECVPLNHPSGLVSADHAFHSEQESVVGYASSNFGEKGSCTDISELMNNTKELKQKVKDYIRSQSDTFKSGVFSDKVKLASPGFKDRYYGLKFSAKSPQEMEHTRKELVQKYTEGLLWVLKYYFSAVPSWNWFYPYHYGPFASDLKGLAQVKVQFQEGLPLKPYDQLLAVLPPQSAHALPDEYQKLMLDEDSAIADFYPTDIEMDAVGKRFMWQAIWKLPFIDEYRLLKETRKSEKELKEHEKVRNAETADRLIVGGLSSLGEQISEVYRSHYSFSLNDAIKINSKMSDGLNGVVHFCEENEEEVPSVFCLYYKLPEGCKYKHHFLEGVTIPEKTITETDVVENQLWHESSFHNMHRAPVKQNYPARVGWRRGRGKFENSTLLTAKSAGLTPYAQTLGSNFYSSSTRSTSTYSLNLNFEKQCTLSASDHDWNRWGSTGQGSLRNSFASNLKSYPKGKDGDIVHKDAGIGLGRGRGTFDNSRPQTGMVTPLKSYAASLGSNFSSTSAGSWRNSTTISTSSAGSWQNNNTRCTSTYDTRSANGSLRNSTTSSTSSAGSWDNNNTRCTSTYDTRSANSGGSLRNSTTSSTSSAWMPSRPVSSALDWQQRNGRGQFAHKTTTSSWNTKNTHRNNYQ